MANRENVCVCCGAKEDYSRFFIIPSMYRTHLPDELKSHRSHDIVLMCFGCHEQASKAQDQLKQRLADEHGVPLNSFMPNKNRNLVIQQLQRASTTLLKAGGRIPDEKQEDLRNLIISQLVQHESLLVDEVVPKQIIEDAKANNFTDELLRTVSNVQLRRLTNKDKQNPHGLHIVDIYKEKRELQDFIRMWRQHFLDSNELKHLPAGWRVDHKMERNFGAHSVFTND